jgi:iron-sulfur cluster assembly accessory protein
MSEVATMESAVSLTKGAIDEIRSLLAKSENSGKNLRLYIEQGGCSGMLYGMVFDEKCDGDLISEKDGVNVLIDPVSAN